MVYSARATLNTAASRNIYLGGVKKAGVVTIGSHPNIRNQAVLWRAPQKSPSFVQMTLLTTRNPLQVKSGYRATRKPI
jgi:hypothetical protein